MPIDRESLVAVDPACAGATMGIRGRRPHRPPMRASVRSDPARMRGAAKAAA